MSADMLLNDIQGGTNKYYLGIGKAGEWDDAILTGSAAPYPVGTAADESRLKDNLAALFKVTTANSSIMIPKVPAEDGVKYKVYDPLDPTCFYEDYENDVKPCFVVTDPNHIFICIRKTGDTTLSGSANLAANLSDYGMIILGDYTWAYIGRYDLYNDLNTSGFVAVTNTVNTSPLGDNVVASALVVGPTQYSSLVISADPDLLPGDAGNYVDYTQYSSVVTPQVFANGATAAGGVTYITVEYPTGTTADELKDYINGVTGFEIEASIPLNQDNNGSGTVGATGSIRLEGGGISETVAKNETGGLVYDFKVVNGGSGYNNDTATPQPTGATSYIITNCEVVGLSETGVERSATVSVTIDVDHDTDNGTITGITRNVVDIDDLKTAKDFAEGKLILGTLPGDMSLPDNKEDEAVFVPYIAPIEGFGGIKFKTLPAWYVGIFGDTAEADYIPDNTVYRQVSLLRNPLDENGDLLDKSYALPLPYFEFYAEDDPDEVDPLNAINANPGDRIVQNGKDCGRLEYIQTQEVSGGDLIPLSPYRYYYSTNITDGYVPLNTTDAITFVPLNGDPAVPSTPIPPTVLQDPADYTPNSGDVIFQDNRGGITRETGQNEELKIIIQH